MEAPENSGALITARLANEFGRDVYTLPNSPDQIKSRGCLRLIHNGAEVIITEEELLSMLGAIPQLDSPQQLSLFEAQVKSSTPSISATPPQPKLEPPFSIVFEATADSPTPFDVIVAKSGLSAGEVSGILLQLELDGLVSQLAGMRYQKQSIL
jgi:DNA processing protein